MILLFPLCLRGYLSFRQVMPCIPIILHWTGCFPNRYIPKRGMFATNLHPAAEIVIGKNVEKMKSKQGHIVIRVLPGGAEYYVYILEDSNTKRKIKQIYGPYVCRSASCSEAAK